MSSRSRVVLTGFEAFGAWSENPTPAVLAALRHAPDIDADLTTIVLPVDTTRVASLVADTLETIRPDLWIGLGLAAGLAVVAVERIAANVLDFGIPDNAGVSRQDQPVADTGPAAYFATLPVRLITDALRADGIPARVSNSASTYLCNQLMYTVLHQVTVRGLPTRAGFLHLPAHPALAALQPVSRPDMPSMSIEVMTEAVRVALRTTLGGSRADSPHR